MPKLVVALGGSTWFSGMLIGASDPFVFTTPFKVGKPITFNPFEVIRFPFESIWKLPARVSRLLLLSLITKKPFPCKATSVSTPVALGEPLEKLVSIELTCVPEPNWIALPTRSNQSADRRDRRS